ncbi:MAG TPA: tetratricopeptide repeat protein [Terriglobales bacterium]|nr:tetratricopeptide repeat protein [Terriglobales bacterium]
MDDARNTREAEDHYYAALDLVAEGKVADAVVEYKRALEADPTFADAMHGLTRAYQDLEKFDDAIAVANRLAEIDPNDILAHTSLSILYQRKGMIPEAEAEANKARILGWKQQLSEQKKGSV